MAEKAVVHYQIVVGGMKLNKAVTVEAEDKISVKEYGLCDDVVLIDGDIKAAYIHRANLVAIVVDKASDIK